MKKILVLCLLVLGCSLAFAGPAHARDSRKRHAHSAAHEHGVAYMELEVDGREVEIELDSALYNFISFENEPKTGAQKQEVRAMAARLYKAETLFLFPAQAMCRQKDVDLDSDVIDDDLLELKRSRSVRRDRSHSRQRGHGNLEAEFTFTCRHPERLNGVTVALFKDFPNLRQIQVRMSTPRGKKAATLSPRSNTLRW